MSMAWFQGLICFVKGPGHIIAEVKSHLCCGHRNQQGSDWDGEGSPADRKSFQTG